MRPAVAIVFGLCGCVSNDLSYGPVGGPKNRAYGYSDMRRPDGGFTVTISYKATRDALPVLHAYFDRRAEELCMGPPAKKTVVKAERPNFILDSGYFEPNQQRGLSVLLEGIVYCGVSAAVEASASDEPRPADAASPTQE